MKIKNNAKKIKNFVSKRSTKAIALCVVALSLIVTLFNSVNFPEVVQQVRKIQKLVLEGLVLTKDPNTVYHREEILNDYKNLISDDFNIPAGLHDRVGFWFDIYTRWDANKKVVHHSTYPWIVFEVIDVADIINSDTPRVRWLRNVKAEEFTESEVQKIKDTLKAFAKGQEPDKDSEFQQNLARILEGVPGNNLAAKAKDSLKNLRVQTGQKNFFAEGLEVSPLYLRGMEEIFRNHGLPTELTRIPFVESSFNRHAVSKVGASGIWQFMDYTGKSFMTVNEHIDERNSPFKATEAAARLLKENHMILLKSWPLAVTAWNHGPSGLRKAMKATGSQDLAEIIKSYQSKSFDFASSNFYSEFLGALYAEKYHEEIFENLEYEKTLDLHKVKLSRAVSAKELLRKSGLAKEDFILFNPDLKKALDNNVTIPSGFSFIVDTPARFILKGLLTKDTRNSDETKISQSDVSSNESSRN